MKSVYKALCPIYRDREMESEIEAEWIMDSLGNTELTLHLFTKVLFRVAHNWAMHVDRDEYCEILDKVFRRIT